jgi:hypothetical protein
VAVSVGSDNRPPKRYRQARKEVSYPAAPATAGGRVRVTIEYARK